MQRFELRCRVTRNHVTRRLLRCNDEVDLRKLASVCSQRPTEVVIVGPAPQPVVQPLKYQHRVRTNLRLDDAHATIRISPDEVDERGALLTWSPRRKLSFPGLEVQHFRPQQPLETMFDMRVVNPLQSVGGSECRCRDEAKDHVVRRRARQVQPFRRPTVELALGVDPGDDRQAGF